MGHEDDGFGAMLGSIFNGRDGTHDALVVCDFLRRVERDVEIHLKRVGWLALRSVALSTVKCNLNEGAYTDQDPLVLQINICYGKFVRKRHFDTRRMDF